MCRLRNSKESLVEGVPIWQPNDILSRSRRSWSSSDLPNHLQILHLFDFPQQITTSLWSYILIPSSLSYFTKPNTVLLRQRKKKQNKVWWGPLWQSCTMLTNNYNILCRQQHSDQKEREGAQRLFLLESSQGFYSRTESAERCLYKLRRLQAAT